MTRQRRWQLKQMARGTCIICGQPQAKKSTIYCDLHQEADRARHRTAYLKR